MATITATQTLGFARLNANLKDRTPIIASLLNTALLGLSVYVVIEVFFAQVDEIGGWNKQQSIVLYGSFIFIRSFVQMVVMPNCEALSRHVSNSSIDTYLMKPIDAQILLAFSQLRFWNILGVLLGLGLMLFGSHGNGLTAQGAILYLAHLLLACTLIYAVWCCIACLAFWTKKTNNLSHMFFMFLTTGRFPASAYPAWIQVVIMSVVPVFFAIQVPAQSALGIADWQNFASGCAVTFFFITLARILWRVGLRKYMSGQH